MEEYGMKVAYLDVEKGVKQEILENMGLIEHIKRKISSFLTK